MAFTKNWTGPQGIEAVAAYIRTQELSIVGKDEIVFRVRVFKDSKAAVPFDDFGVKCAYDLSGANPIAQAYAHLKTLPNFEGAVDC